MRPSSLSATVGSGKPRGHRSIPGAVRDSRRGAQTSWGTRPLVCLPRALRTSRPVTVATSPDSELCGDSAGSPWHPPAPHSRPDQAETSPEHGLFPERQPPGLELVPKPSPQVQGGARFWGPLVGRPTAPQKAPLRGKDAPRGWWALGPHPQGKEAWAAGRARQACRVGAPTLAGGAQGISQECHGGAAAGRGRARLAASQGSPAPWALCLKLPHRGWESTPASPGAPPLSTDSVGACPVLGPGSRSLQAAHCHPRGVVASDPSVPGRSPVGLGAGGGRGGPATHTICRGRRPAVLRPHPKRRAWARLTFVPEQ